ncbi:MAG: ROK family protein [Symbiobacteriaceae bacterium]|nr:ROK family protein [Symbiobacteriaceae bacterium]
MPGYLLGIDLGGTSIKAALLDEKLQILRRHSVRTPQEDATAVIRSMADACRVLLAAEEITLEDVFSLGIGAPGIIDNDRGKVVYANNLPFVDVDLRDLIHDELPLTIYLENDANAAALAEAWLGANQGMKDSMVITLGTGVGGGVITDGRILHGNQFAGGEVGHMVIVAGGAQCNCGRRGCWETYSAAASLMRMARAAAQDDLTSALWQACTNDLELLRPEQVFDLAFSGDKAARSVYDRYIFLLKQAVVNLVSIFRPQQIAIGGGLGNQRERLTEPLQEAVALESYAGRYVKPTRVVSTQLGADSGLYGAALLGRYYQGGISVAG